MINSYIHFEFKSHSNIELIILHFLRIYIQIFKEINNNNSKNNSIGKENVKIKKKSKITFFTFQLRTNSNTIQTEDFFLFGEIKKDIFWDALGFANKIDVFFV
jgi:hypothetical protein